MRDKGYITSTGEMIQFIANFSSETIETIKVAVFFKC
jgi:hypothetical protein